MVPANSDRIPRVPPYSGAPLVPAPLPVRGYHPLRPAFPDRSGSSPFPYVKSYYPGCAVTLPVWALSVSIATTPDIDISFSSCRYLDVSVPCVRPDYMPVSVLQTDGLPHSDISGSIPVCSSPELFAAYHVLLRLLKPRHPPYALFRFLCCSRLEIVSFRPLLFPRYLFPILSKIFHRISSMSFAGFRVGSRILQKRLVIPTRSASRQSSRLKTPKRRCSSHTFRYGYLVTT